MTVATVFVLGGHAFQLDDVDTDTETALVALAAHAWAADTAVGHIELAPKPGVSLRISVRDVVAVEIDHTR